MPDPAVLTLAPTWHLAYTFTVVGQPITQGSKTPFRSKNGHMIVKEDRDKVLRPWRSLLNEEAKTAMAGRPYHEGPVRLELDFWIPRPIGAPKTRRTWPIKKGSDSDKLARAVMDSLSKVVYRDDSQVVDLHPRKDYAVGRPVGVDVRVWLIEETP